MLLSIISIYKCFNRGLVIIRFLFLLLGCSFIVLNQVANNQGPTFVRVLKESFSHTIYYELFDDLIYIIQNPPITRIRSASVLVPKKVPIFI